MLIRRINVIQTCILMLMTNAITNHVIIIPLMLQSGKRDAWLSTIVAMVPAFLLAFIVLSILRATAHQSLHNWLKTLIGRLGAWIFAFIFFVYLLSLDLISLKDTTTWVNVTFLPYTPPIVIGSLLVALCFMAAYKGLWTITVCAGVLLPFVVLFGFFVSASNLQYKDYSLLQPVLENGFGPVLNGTLYAVGGVFELILFLLLKQHMNRSIRLPALLVFVLITIGLIAGPLMGALANFGHEAMQQRYPAYEQWRLVSLGKYITHLDFLSIYQWLSGSFVRISLFMFLLADLLQLKRRHARLGFLIPLGVAMILALMVPVSDMQFIRFLRYIYYPVSTAILSLLMIVLLLLSFITRLRNRRNSRNGSSIEQT